MTQVLDVERLMTESLRSFRWGPIAGRVMASALNAVDPGQAVYHCMRRLGDQLIIGNRIFPLTHFNRIWLIGAGKAGALMTKAAVNILGDRLSGGLVIVKEGYTGESDNRRVTIRQAGHPIPDQRGVNATHEMLKILADLATDDLVICLISGGGSALLVSPVDGISLQDIQELTAALLACGANIYEINTLRKHLDRVKGGGLARLTHPATIVALILSDVIGDTLETIASGPTAPDPSTFNEALLVLEKYELNRRISPKILSYLRQGQRKEVAETPKIDDPIFTTVENVIIGSNRQAAQAALQQAETEGLNSLLLTTFLQGEARQAGKMLAAIARQIDATGQPIPRPACLVTGGETTVTVKGAGLGGRNQEMALGSVNEMAGLPEIALVTLATDGGDGPTDAAGAVVTGDTLRRAQQLGLSPDDTLFRNDSYHFFDALGDLLKPGPTLTNVNDLAFLFAFPK